MSNTSLLQDSKSSINPWIFGKGSRQSGYTKKFRRHLVLNYLWKNEKHNLYLSNISSISRASQSALYKLLALINTTRDRLCSLRSKVSPSITCRLPSSWWRRWLWQGQQKSQPSATVTIIYGVCYMHRFIYPPSPHHCEVAPTGNN